MRQGSSIPVCVGQLEVELLDVGELEALGVEVESPEGGVPGGRVVGPVPPPGGDTGRDEDGADRSPCRWKHEVQQGKDSQGSNKGPKLSNRSRWGRDENPPPPKVH